VGLFCTLISRPPIALQIFNLVREKDLTETVEKYISQFIRFERDAVGNKMVGHLARKNLTRSIVTESVWRQIVQFHKMKFGYQFHVQLESGTLWRSTNKNLFGSSLYPLDEAIICCRFNPLKV
jgi:hypothetical protein